MRGTMLYRRDLVEPLALHDGVRVLEIGVGDGETAAEVAHWIQMAGIGGEVVALDYDPKRGPRLARTAKARGVADRVRFVVGDARSLPALGERFDVIVCVNTLSQVVLEGHGAALRAMDERAGRSRWPEVSIEAVADVTRSVLAHWKRHLAPRGQLVVMDVDGDARDDAHARGLALYQRSNWPPLPASLLERALPHVGFSRVATRRAHEVSFASADAMVDWMGVPLGVRSSRPPASIGPSPNVSLEGPAAITMTLVQAWS